MILNDSPDLSDLTEGRFEEINGGGAQRTSTPNLAKRKRSSSVSSSEIKFIRKQLQGKS